MLKTLLLAALLCAPVLAEDQLITGNGAKTKVFLEDKSDDLRVLGNNNTLTVTGQGDAIHISGNGNHLDVDATFSDINLMGNGNKVTFRLKPGQQKPDVASLGKDNVVDFVEGPKKP